MTIDDRIPEAVRAARAATTEDRTARLKRDTHRWARWLHVYSSMLALLLMLFFGITGITLNHPSWTFGDATEVSTQTGTLPFSATFPDGTTDYLSISEFVRGEYDVNGQVDAFQTSNGQATISYRNAGYAADVFVDTDRNTYDITIEQQGWVGVLNDLHKGRDTAPLWKWVVDISAGFLVVIALTGLTMQFFLRKRRRSAFVSVGAGFVLMLVLMWLTLR
jgi:hypothetical protein